MSAGGIRTESFMLMLFLSSLKPKDISETSPSLPLVLQRRSANSVCRLPEFSGAGPAWGVTICWFAIGCLENDEARSPGLRFCLPNAMKIIPT